MNKKVDMMTYIKMIKESTLQPTPRSRIVEIITRAYPEEAKEVIESKISEVYDKKR